MLDIAILEGVRTPFVKVFGALASLPAQELGRVAAVGVLDRSQFPRERIDQVVFGNGAVPPESPNPARVIAIRAGIPLDRIAHTVQRNCASGLEAVTTAAQLLQLGEAEAVLAGGTESMSQIPFLFSSDAAERFIHLNKTKGWRERLKAFARFRPRHFAPVPAIKMGLTDPVCGLLMGETAEILADDFKIDRAEQDRFALASHLRAGAAQKDCRLSEEIVACRHESLAKPVEKDIGPRSSQTLEALAKLAPFFRKNGTVTVGNSCSVTDGAAAVILVTGGVARAADRPILGYLRGYSYAGCDPKRMGLGPVFAIHKLLNKTGIDFKDIELFEINEAFAAQVIGCLRALASPDFCRRHLGRAKPIGDIDPAILNVNGGAIALGHPVGATGTRLVITLLKEMRRRKKRWGVATLCIGGGQGGAILLESPQ
jgi:acetyl-CoA C-acetyltransferase/acetyl-CoA acyltransferase